MSIFRRLMTIYVSLLANICVLYHILSEKSRGNENKLQDLTRSRRKYKRAYEHKCISHKNLVDFVWMGWYFLVFGRFLRDFA